MSDRRISGFRKGFFSPRVAGASGAAAAIAGTTINIAAPGWAGRVVTSTMNELHDDLPACVGCAKCCHLLVELTPGVDDAVPEEWVVEHSGVRCMDQRGDGACVALDTATQRCTIYELRPQVCRDFQRGSALCRRAVAGRRGALAPAE